MFSTKSFTHLAVVAVAVGFSGVASAAEITSVSATPVALTVNQSATASFVISIDAISGTVGKGSSPSQVSYCSEWSIHSDGTVSCDAFSLIDLDKARNYNKVPVGASEYGRTV